MRMKSFVCLLGAALLLATAGGAAAQEFRATVRGQVLDSSKGALPGATVTLTNISTNEAATAVTNTEGSYSVPFLRPGSYTMTVELSGFQKSTRAGMVLQVNETATINVEMGVGGLTGQVSVTAESPLLETSNASRGTVIDSARIAEIPLQSRSPMALATLVAGVNYNAQAVYLRPFDNGALADWSMNGGQNRNNEFLLDGAPNNANQGGNNIAYVPPAAAVQEFKVSTNSYDAQYGRTAGGVINMTLKSGTNSFHGEAYDFMRRKALAANSFLLNSRSAPKTDQYIDQYGFSVDGPIFKNKTFFLFTGRSTGKAARPAVRHSADAGDEKRRLQRSRGCVRTTDHRLRSGDRPGGERRLDARSVPGQQDSSRSHQSRRPGRSCSTIRIRTERPPAWRRGSRTCSGPSTSTRTCSGTGSGRSTTTSARTTGSSSAGARTSGTRSATGERTPFAPVRPRAASFRSGAPTARWSATRCGSSAPGPYSTCAPATPTSLSGAIPNTQSASTRRSSGPRVSSTDAQPGNRRHLPRHQDRSVPVHVARLVAQPQPQLHGSAQRVTDPRQAQHPQRSRHAVDQRLQRELQQLGGNVRSTVTSRGAR